MWRRCGRGAPGGICGAVLGICGAVTVRDYMLFVAPRGPAGAVYVPRGLLASSKALWARFTEPHQPSPPVVAVVRLVGAPRLRLVHAPKVRLVGAPRVRLVRVDVVPRPPRAPEIARASSSAHFDTPLAPPHRHSPHHRAALRAHRGALYTLVGSMEAWANAGTRLRLAFPIGPPCTVFPCV